MLKARGRLKPQGTTKAGQPAQRPAERLRHLARARRQRPLRYKGRLHDTATTLGFVSAPTVSLGNHACRQGYRKPNKGLYPCGAHDCGTDLHSRSSRSYRKRIPLHRLAHATDWSHLPPRLPACRAARSSVQLTLSRSLIALTAHGSAARQGCDWQIQSHSTCQFRQKALWVTSNGTRVAMYRTP